MSLRALQIFSYFSAGIDFRRQNLYRRQILTIKVYPRAVRFKSVRLACALIQSTFYPLEVTHGHGAMVRAWRSADVAVCRAVLNTAWCRIFREISCFSTLNLGTLLLCCVLGQGTSSSNASLDSGENEYLVGQRWQCIR